MRRLGLLIGLALMFADGAPALAQTVHRTNVPAGEATPTGGSFSIEFPVAYTDVEVNAENPPNPPIIVRTLNGRTEDGTALSATEMLLPPGITPAPIESLMNTLATKPSVAHLLDVHHAQGDGRETLSFTLIDPIGGGNFFDMIRTDKAQYTLMIQFHPGRRDNAAAMKDAFFGSFKLIGK